MSFITSIATGIVTVSLMDQAPPSVTETIHRVVERTVERVVPENLPAGSGAAVIKETIVVKESDSAPDAIRKAAPGVARVKGTDVLGDPMTFRSLGLILRSDGLMAADRAAVPEDADYAMELDGSLIPLSIAARNDKLGLVLLLPVQSSGESKIFAVSPLASAAPVLGQTVIVFAGRETNSVATGIISGLLEAPVEVRNAATSSPAGEKAAVVIRTDFDNKDVLPGSVLINLSGEVVGVRLKHFDSFDKNEFVPIAKIVSLLKESPINLTPRR
ncbi:MAG: hypothetical protein HYT43_01950 [Candidatus Taylorbacteria bacterium]|nr:hypothetical protein [Candidatus Taylorbacteria bacterium]